VPSGVHPQNVAEDDEAVLADIAATCPISDRHGLTFVAIRKKGQRARKTPELIDIV